MKTCIAAIFVLSSASLAPALVSAEETIPSEGLWTKFSVGAASTAYAAVATADVGTEITASATGGAPEFRGAVGIVVSPGNVLHASVGFNRLAEPELKAEFDGLEITETSDSTLSLISACAGITHYLGEASITARAGYASQSEDNGADGSKGWLSGLGVDYDLSTSEKSRFGVGLNLDYAELEFSSGDSQSFASLGVFISSAFY